MVSMMHHSPMKDVEPLSPIQYILDKTIYKEKKENMIKTKLMKKISVNFK